jgi:GAF domain-containing protein
MSMIPGSTLADSERLIADLQRQLAECQAERDEALQRETATAEVLGVINSSPGNLTPVFNAMLDRAMRLCEASFGALFIREGERFRAVATHGLSARLNDFVRQGFVFSPPDRNPIHRGEAVAHVLDLTKEPLADQPGRAAAVELGGARTMLGVALRKDGILLGTFSVFRQEVRAFSDKQIALLQNFAAQAVIAIDNARLITETREALEQQTATAEVLGVINASPGDLAPVFNAILEKAQTLCDAAYGSLMLRDGDRFRAVAVYSVSETFAERLREGFPLDDPFVKRLLDGDNFVHNPDMAEVDHPIARTAVELTGVRTRLLVPLRKDDVLLGAISVIRREVRPFSDQQIALLQNFAAQAVIAMENARLLTETREALEQQTATAEVLQVINASPGDLAPVFDTMLERAMRLCEADYGHILTSDRQQFHPAAIQGEARFVEWLRRRGSIAIPAVRDTNASPLARVMRGERVAQVADATQEKTYRTHPVYKELVDISGIRSSAAVALRKEEALLGAIVVYRREVRQFSEKEIALLENFAAQAVIAMENARLITETREALEQQTATAEVLGVINSSPGDLEPVFDAMLDKALDLCGAAFGNLWTFDGERFRAGALRRVPEAYADVLLRGPVLPRPGAVLGHIAAGSAVAHIIDAAVEDAYMNTNARTLVELGGAHTVAGVALRRDGSLLGAITIFRQEVRPFTDKQIALLQNFASQAVIAMENARLITETREALEQQTATAEVLGVINSSPGDLGPVFDAILEKACTLCGAAHGALAVFEGECIRGVATHGMSEPYAEIVRQSRRHDPGGVLDPLVKGERLVQIPDMRRFTGTGDAARAAVAAGSRTFLAIPLRNDGRLLGFITAHRKEVCPFTDKQIALLENFAAQAVVAIENARLLGELRQRTEEVAELNRGLEARVAEQVEELGRVGRLKRFLAPQLAELIVSHGDEKILESHRREIVVVFCDLRGYTAFTETAEPEEVLDFLRQYHGALGPLVSQFEGTLDQFSGDGIMVFFNDPMPCPDPAERAVKMAVAMREAAGALTIAWRRRGRVLGFGAGIAQGYATLGQIGFADRSGYTAIGTVCNLAARLCAEAKDGQILIAQRVAIAVEETTPLEEVGELTLKGLTQPVMAYNVPLQAAQPVLRVIEGGGPQSV